MLPTMQKNTPETRNSPRYDRSQNPSISSEQDHIFYKNMFLHLGLAEGPFSGKAEVFLASFENIRGFNTIVGK